ncbi:monovalent cation/H(+) antiporter subunit G [Nocardia farcinica]|uniref:Multiple resistance and pH homeostasis protein G n=2 Tax=Nocardia farcinica TaxID=37329 RepID=A0A0H5P1H3_NOCFR|nr:MULTISPECIES: monovalent cation/H(+) antiporter subunit G [Nocardia]AXK87455.1 monovalent cation/H(+) antiporter subunit G [Nocardia farcinica]MBA4858186.1 monovalent cation/H(+) antiporter subunit G [Nocardia farcinica]MBC9816973.1 monovalent cation/H(+) antiporter subunit G [Nocardia farcinica]MBF6072669.1 monovalent cation/H(+) antiporter subunit G [Nocardia farcinica]MBF6141278.1 monovalent cation/H(+) antiporter subunit G [Nocardia farcinica]
MSGWQWLSAVLILGGAGLSCTAAIALLRFPDTLTRMHAATKPQIVGLILVLAGAAIELAGRGNVWLLALVGVFTLLTAPVIAHLLGRTAYREQRHRDGLLMVNELGDALENPDERF